MPLESYTARFRAQLDRLTQAARELRQRARSTGSRRLINDEPVLGLPPEAAGWAARVRSALVQPGVPKSFRDTYEEQCSRLYDTDDLDKAIGIVNGLGADIDDGHIPSLSTRVRGDTLATLLEIADIELQERSTAPSVMIAGAVLEAHLRFLGENRGLTITGRSAIGKWNEALVRADVYSGAQRSAIDSWATMRNDADHLTQTSFEVSAVTAMLTGVRTLLATLPE